MGELLGRRSKPRELGLAMLVLGFSCGRVTGPLGGATLCNLNSVSAWVLTMGMPLAPLSAIHLFAAPVPAGVQFFNINNWKGVATNPFATDMHASN